MKITRRQLKRIIREARRGWDDDDYVRPNYEGGEDRGLAASEYTLPPRQSPGVDDYKKWAKDYMGTLSGANSASVLATYVVELGLSKPEWTEIAMSMEFDPRDVDYEISGIRREQL